MGELPPATGDHVTANVERFSGFADRYDAYRPQPPPVIIDVLLQMLGMARPERVVDVGCGTGLSTRVWAGSADEVIGIEPNADMRRQAELSTAALGDEAGIRYQDGLSTRTGLPDACADIVTISQALHWMEPEPTFAEIARILRPGGLFAAIDCDWPPVLHWEMEQAYLAFEARAQEVSDRRGLAADVRRWQKSEHLARIRESGRFRYTREVCVHGAETGNADRLVGLALSQGSVATLLKAGVSEDEFGLDVLRAEAKRVLGDASKPWYFTYRIRVGVR